MENDIDCYAYTKFNNIDFVHIVGKYSSHDMLNTNGNFCDHVCSTRTFFKALVLIKKLLSYLVFLII